MQAKVILKNIKGHPYLEYKTATKRFNNALYFTFALKEDFIEKIKQEKGLGPIFKDLIKKFEQYSEYDTSSVIDDMMTCGWFIKNDETQSDLDFFERYVNIQFREIVVED